MCGVVQLNRSILQIRIQHGFSLTARNVLHEEMDTSRLKTYHLAQHEGKRVLSLSKASWLFCGRCRVSSPHIPSKARQVFCLFFGRAVKQQERREKSFSLPLLDYGGSFLLGCLRQRLRSRAFATRYCPSQVLFGAQVLPQKINHYHGEVLPLSLPPPFSEALLAPR